MIELFVSGLFILALGQDPVESQDVPNALGEACGFAPGGTLTDDKIECVDRIVVEILAGQEDGYLTPDLEITDPFASDHSSDNCYHGRWIEPVWPHDEDGNIIVTLEGGLDITMVFDLLEDGTTTNVQVESVSPADFGQADAFIEAALHAVRRWRYGCRGQEEGLQTTLSFQMDF